MGEFTALLGEDLAFIGKRLLEMNPAPGHPMSKELALPRIEWAQERQGQLADLITRLVNVPVPAKRVPCGASSKYVGLTDQGDYRWECEGCGHIDITPSNGLPTEPHYRREITP